MDDVCIIIENTRSHFSSGIPLHALDIIESSPELKFAVVCISNKQLSGDVLVTSYPANLNTFMNIHLDNAVIYKTPTPQKKNSLEMWKNIFQFYRAELKEKTVHFEKMIDGLVNDETRILNMKDILFSKEMWNFITEDYNLKEIAIPFLHYYKIFYLTQIPLFQLMNIVIPRAKIYHAFSGMYANWFSLIAKRKYSTPLIIDEREIAPAAMDFRSGFFSSLEALNLSLDPHSMDVLQEFRAVTGNSIKYLSYSYADVIVTQYAEQQREGEEYFKEAIPKMVQIQRGIKEREEAAAGKEGMQKGKRYLVGLVGSFIPADDIKTFIRASHLITLEMENVNFRIVASGDGDEEYMLECTHLRNNLDLALKMEVSMDGGWESHLAEFDILVSTSLGDRHSSFLLMAMDMGIPLVATNRGRHAELIHGDGGADSNLGECGFITDIGTPEQIAHAVMEILKDKSLRKAMGRIGKKRIETHYMKEDNLKKYYKLYKDYL